MGCSRYPQPPSGPSSCLPSLAELLLHAATCCYMLPFLLLPHCLLSTSLTGCSCPLIPKFTWAKNANYAKYVNNPYFAETASIVFIIIIIIINYLVKTHRKMQIMLMLLILLKVLALHSASSTVSEKLLASDANYANSADSQCNMVALLWCHVTEKPHWLLPFFLCQAGHSCMWQIQENKPFSQNHCCYHHLSP